MSYNNNKIHNFVEVIIAMLDSPDRQLIDLLQQNAQQPSRALAKQLGVNSSTVRRRVKRLIQQGIIRIIAIPKPEEIGLNLRVVVAFKVALDQLKAFVKQLGSNPNVRFLAVTSGQFDVLASMWFEPTDQLYVFMEEEVVKMEGLRGTETFVCLHVEKTA
ncbi:Lrp/AsnC family transcriptional regulator [Chloroflexota bacterium]